MGGRNYNTKQREYVLDCLKENAAYHITAEEILEKLKERKTPVGKSTVYRYLELLLQEGSIRKYAVEDGGCACYQYIREDMECCQHFHLKCLKCQELYHISCKYMEGIGEHIETEHGFQIDQSKTVFYGRCKKCR